MLFSILAFRQPSKPGWLEKLANILEDRNSRNNQDIRN